MTFMFLHVVFRVCNYIQNRTSVVLHCICFVLHQKRFCVQLPFCTARFVQHSEPKKNQSLEQENQHSEPHETAQIGKV